MVISFAAVFPVFLLLMLGNLARRSGFLSESFWEQADKGTYYVLFPALLVSKLSQAEFDWFASVGLLAAAVLLPFCAAALCFTCQYVLRLSDYDFTAFFQGGIRVNNFIGLALIATLPAPALSLLALLMSVIIPIMNVLSVIVLTLYAGGEPDYRKVISGVIRNPLVLACVCGISLNLLQWLPPLVLMAVMDKLGMMALPMGLLAVGAGLKFKTLNTAGKIFIWNTALKLLLMPVLALLLALLLRLDGLALTVFVVYAALPVASSAYILTRYMDGNATLMAGIITGQTLVSMLTLPLVLWFVQSQLVG